MKEDRWRVIALAEHLTHVEVTAIHAAYDDCTVTMKVSPAITQDLFQMSAVPYANLVTLRQLRGLDPLTPQ
jgi:hypothetical protein